MPKLLGKTVQLYVTGKCNMGCLHCNTPRGILDMTIKTFKKTIEWALMNGAERIELFANDPLLHPDIEEMVNILNESGLGYAILTVGDSPHDKETFEKFLKLAEKVDKKRGAFVFSVDFTEETSLEILKNKKNENYDLAFKAETFWGKLSPILLEKRIPVRTNTVISKDNFQEVETIMRRVIEMGFMASFCYIQVRQPEFEELCSEGLTLKLEGKFRKFITDLNLLSQSDISGIISEVKKIIANGELKNDAVFNTFRGSDYSESVISISQLEKLRKELFILKEEFPSKLLPPSDFIKEIGNRGFGCIELMKDQKFPQIKIGTEGQVLFCCDLHDPHTSSYFVDDWNEWTAGIFLEMIRINPYIWICAYFNPCDFSVNRVVYTASKGADNK